MQIRHEHLRREAVIFEAKRMVSGNDIRVTALTSIQNPIKYKPLWEYKILSPQLIEQGNSIDFVCNSQKLADEG